MTAAPDASALSPAKVGAAAELENRLDLIDAVIYADVFGCAVTAEELWRYSRCRADREELHQRLERDPALRGLLCEGHGLLCLTGREELLGRGPQRRRSARRLQRRARLVARALRHAPFVRGLLLTGSAAAGDAGRDGDVDLMVIVAPGRLSVVFMALGPLSRLLSRKLFCPNQYLSQDHLRVGPRDLYVAREIAQSRALAGRAQEFVAANDWIEELLPNAANEASLVAGMPGGGRLQRLGEWMLRGQLGDALDRALRPVVIARLAAHYATGGHGVPDDVLAAFTADRELRFHGAPVHRTALSRYRERRTELARVLAARDS